MSWAAGNEMMAAFILCAHLFIWLCWLLDVAVRLSCPDSCGNLVLDPVLCTGRQILHHWAAREVPAISYL